MDSRGLQSWKIGWLWEAVQTFPRWLDKQSGQIPVGTSLPDHHELNPGWISSYRLLQSWLSEPLQNDQKWTNFEINFFCQMTLVALKNVYRSMKMLCICFLKALVWISNWCIFGHFEGVHSISSGAACRRRFTLDSIHGGQKGLSRPEFVQIVYLIT